MLALLSAASMLAALVSWMPAPIAWRLRHIDLRIAIEPTRQVVTGVSQLTFTTTGDDAAPLVVDASDSLTVDSAVVSGPGGLRIIGAREPGAVRFTIAGRVRPGAPYLASLWFHGHPIRRAVGFAMHQGTPRAASFGIPRSAREWWPSADAPDQKADSADIRISAPSTLIAASNGRLVDRALSADGATATAHWAVRYPIYSDVVSFSLADFTVARSILTLASGDRLPIEFYVFPEDSAKAVVTFAAVPRIMAFLEARLGGYPFPKEKYALAEFGRPSFREGQTITNLGASHITGLADMDQVIAHEMAHQWFGNSLTVINWSEIWLNESLSEYMAWQWIRTSQGDAAYRTLLDQAVGADAPAPIVPANPADFNSLFGNATFQKGPAVLVMLEQLMGVKAFASATRSYVAQHAYKQVESADFQRACEVAYGKSLDAFFAKWIRGNEKLGKVP